jgi:hypothetical protein
VAWGKEPWLLVVMASFFVALLIASWWPHDEPRDPYLVRLTLFMLLPITVCLAGAWCLARHRFRYKDDTLICDSPWGPPRQYRISELSSIGMETGWGTEIITPHGENIYINKYQRGGLALIELITGRKDPDHPDDAEWLRE